MRSEAGKVIARRFSSRIVESGLLILAVALGVGAASSGFSLLANTLKAGSDMLASPTYRELVVSARSSAEEMAAPAVRRPTAANIALTASDLDAAELAPAVAYAYIQNRDEIRFINAQTIAEENAMRTAFMAQIASSGGTESPPAAMAPPEEGGGTAAPPSGEAVAEGGGQSGTASPATAPADSTAAAAARQQQQQPRFMTEDDLKKAQAQADLIIVDFEELAGFRVTPQFFNAWSLTAAAGSLLTESDASGDANAVVLGSKAAEKIAAGKLQVSELIGKKLLSREGKLLVVGVLAPYGQSSIDEAFFAPYKTFAGRGGMPRMWSFNTMLRFAVSDPSKLDETAGILSSWFESRFGESQITISNPRSEAQKLMNRNSGISLLILVLALSGLFIALVNVSHILMSRGLRMRKGVGIMMALGASRLSVLKLFASEATAVAVAGSILGGAFAFPLSRTMQDALGLFGGSWLFVLVGVALSWILTMVCSIVPAWQNSRIVPADAMRAA
jgi:ABC-type lipoprotein release transport system permease subunit